MPQCILFFCAIRLFDFAIVKAKKTRSALTLVQPHAKGCETENEEESMRKFIAFPTATIASVVLAWAVADTALAQTSNEVEAETPSASDAPTVDDNGLAIGQPENDTPKPGDTYVKEVLGDWSLRCIVVEGQDDPCQMYQLLSDEQGQPIAEFTLFRLPEGGQAAAGATVVVPLETGLQQQLTIRVDEEQGKRYPYSFCNTVGCYARIGLTDEDIASYKAGAAAVISIVPALAPDQRVISVTMSLAGFTAAFDQASILDQ